MHAEVERGIKANTATLKRNGKEVSYFDPTAPKT